MTDRKAADKGTGGKKPATGTPARDNVEPLRPKRPCPICGQPSDRKFFPFCSPRCKDVDLNRWLTGHYAVPVVEEDGGTSDDGEGY